jgi:hypothetical protein
MKKRSSVRELCRYDGFLRDFVKLATLPVPLLSWSGAA